MKSKKNIYFIDSSALITIHRYYPKRVFPDLWKHLEELFKTHLIFSHEMVYNEIVPVSGAKDEIGRLIAKYKSSFYSITNKQGHLALQILSIFPRLINAKAKKDEADPWIIALVIEKMEEENLFGKESDFFLISAESEQSDSKIPAACKYFEVKHLNLFQFFEDNGWEFKVTKKI